MLSSLPFSPTGALSGVGVPLGTRLWAAGNEVRVAVCSGLSGPGSMGAVERSARGSQARVRSRRKPLSDRDRVKHAGLFELYHEQVIFQEVFFN